MCGHVWGAGVPFKEVVELKNNYASKPVAAPWLHFLEAPRSKSRWNPEH